MAESTGLLNLRLGNWSEGSNPSLSAIFKLKNARKVPFSTVPGFFSSRFVYSGYIRLIPKKNRDMAVAKIKLDLGARKAISLKNPESERSSERSKETDSAIESNLNGSYPVHVWLRHSGKNLSLSETWAVYEKSPERATPDTVSEALAYRSTFEKFMNWINDPGKTLRDIISQIADEYAQHMRTLNIAVSTHNRKIKRIRRVFRVLREY